MNAREKTRQTQETQAKKSRNASTEAMLRTQHCFCTCVAWVMLDADMQLPANRHCSLDAYWHATAVGLDIKAGLMAGADLGFYKGGCPIHLNGAPEVESRRPRGVGSVPPSPQKIFVFLI